LYVLPTTPLKAGSAIGRAVLTRVVELDAIVPPVGVPPHNDEANHQGGFFPLRRPTQDFLQRRH
jgi:hypothetical protein